MIARPLIPYQWCHRRRARPGHRVTMMDARPEPTTFVLTRVDHKAKSVHFSLPGVWIDREWREMDRDAMYELVKKGA